MGGWGCPWLAAVSLAARRLVEVAGAFYNKSVGAMVSNHKSVGAVVVLATSNFTRITVGGDGMYYAFG